MSQNFDGPLATQVPQLEPADVARVCHEAVRAYDVIVGDPVPPSWDEAPDWMKTSVIYGVIAAATNRYATPQSMHETWMAHKLSDGWVYGETKSWENKTHPDLVPYEKLPDVQRRKDVLFLSVVRAVIHASPLAETK